MRGEGRGLRGDPNDCRNNRGALRENASRMRTLVAIPVFNERPRVGPVLERVLAHARDVLVVDDGSHDGTAEALASQPVRVHRHDENRGYGRALLSAFRDAEDRGYDWLITLDADGQHDPEEIPLFLDAARRGAADIVSGSRYLRRRADDDDAPPARRRINAAITRELNARLGLGITDSFCGFKAYRVATLARLALSEPGYGFPIQLWVRAAAQGARVAEVPVRRIYVSPHRTFGGGLDDPTARLAHYRALLDAEIHAHAARR